MAASLENMHTGFPVSTKQTLEGLPLRTQRRLHYQRAAYKVNDVSTEIVVSHFTDKLFIVLTQYEKLGSMFQINKEIVLDEMQQSSTVYNIKVLLGKDEPMSHVIAKNLTSEINTNKQIILTVALKDSSPQTVKILKSLVSECCS